MTQRKPSRVVVAYGTRPEAVKLAPVVHALQASDSVQPIVVVSGQHREMLDQVNRVFAIVPDHDLEILTPAQTLADIVSRALRGYSAFFSELDIDALVVQGDTSSALAAALAGFYQKIPVVHLEAGLRTGDRYSPYPEEINRRLLTQLTTLHLAPTKCNRYNLEREGVAPADITVTGNTVIDAFLSVTEERRAVGVPRVDTAIADGRRIVLVTAHRREAWGQPMRNIGQALSQLADLWRDVLFVLPAHPNPVVREQLLPLLGARSNIAVTEPIDYAPFCALVAASTLVLTDSGGLQEEAPSAGKPVIVMRDTTERPEGVEAGTVELVGTNSERIVKRVSRLLSDQVAYGAMAHAINPYGDGHAAARCRAAIESLLGYGPRLPDFDSVECTLRAPTVETQ